MVSIPKESDKQFHALVNARNQADSMIHGTEKSMKEMGDKIDAAEKSSIEAVIAELKELMKQDNKDAIEAKTKELTDLSGKLAERLYANQGQEAASGPAGASAEQPKDNVVDAEFEEVRDEDRKN